jgi:hypothetical protein
MERNFERVDKKEEVYLGCKILSWRDKWEEYNVVKDKWVNKSQVFCYLYRLGSKYQPINLGECNDGSKFTSVNQAINQAKDYVNCCKEHYRL